MSDIDVENKVEEIADNTDNKKEMMLQGIVEIGEISYNEENDRKKLLIEQSTNMIIALTLLITFLGMILPVILDFTDEKVYVFIGFVCSTFPLFASLVCVILVQWRVKYLGSLNALEFFNEVKNNFDKYLEKSNFYEVKIGNLGEMTKAMNKNNNRRVKLIKASHILVFVSIYFILQFTLLITLK